eukprot:6175781-Pleurochrysis_carterae.AAC.4
MRVSTRDGSETLGVQHHRLAAKRSKPDLALRNSTEQQRLAHATHATPHATHPSSRARCSTAWRRDPRKRSTCAGVGAGVGLGVFAGVSVRKGVRGCVRCFVLLSKTSGRGSGPRGQPERRQRCRVAGAAQRQARQLSCRARRPYECSEGDFKSASNKKSASPAPSCQHDENVTCPAA